MRSLQRRLAWLLLWPVLASAQPVEYGVSFGATLQANQQQVEAYIRVKQKQLLLEEVRLRAPAARYSNFRGDGEIRRQDDRVFWRPPASGGKLRYQVKLKQRRNGSGYDALVRKDWAIFRLDDLFPPAGISQADGTRSRSRLVMSAPDNWQVLTRYPRADDDAWQVVNPVRKFDRPTGWAVAGRLNSRRDRIGGMDVAVAAPLGQGAQRVAMLGLLRWTLPDILELVESPPERLLITSAGDPMWRGGLSGPASLFIHADLPLISEDGTSTLVHETLHALLPVPTAEDHDWIDEGLAEYLTLDVLARSGTISRRRFRQSVDRFRRRGAQAESLLTPNAAGPVTARAVALFYDLDRDLKKATGGKADMRDLARRLAQQSEKVDLDRLRALAEELSDGKPLPSLDKAPRSAARP